MLAQVYLELIGGKQRKIEFENNIKSLNNKIVENVNVEQKLKQLVQKETNQQLNQFSNMYFNKLKKSLIIYDL